ncbi:MAG: hypothetical protein ABIR28_07600 [Vicinamibacteria bacterium]
MLMIGGIGAGGAVLLLVMAAGHGPTGRPADDLATFAVWIGMTAAMMLAACRRSRQFPRATAAAVIDPPLTKEMVRNSGSWSTPRRGY